MKSKYKNLFYIILSISITMSMFILSVKFVLAFTPLYYYDIKHLSIAKESNIDEADIKRNYDYVINFLQDKNQAEFKLPTLISSKDGTTHFLEVKTIFIKLNHILAATSIISLICIILCIKYKTFKVFKWSGISLLVIPIVLALPFIINFDESFTMFHKIVFRNNYWLFDPVNDPIINILPETFFFHCALLIFIIMLLFSFVCIFIYFLCNKYFNKVKLQNKAIEDH